jgi:hypothetical protein
MDFIKINVASITIVGSFPPVDTSKRTFACLSRKTPSVLQTYANSRPETTVGLAMVFEFIV